MSLADKPFLQLPALDSLTIIPSPSTCSLGPQVDSVVVVGTVDSKSPCSTDCPPDPVPSNDPLKAVNSGVSHGFVTSINYDQTIEFQQTDPGPAYHASRLWNVFVLKENHQNLLPLFQLEHKHTAHRILIT